MKKLLAAAAAVSMLAVAAPAFAQYRDNDRDGRYDRDDGYDRDGRYDRDRDYDRDHRRGDRGDFNINAEQRRLEQRIYAGQRSGRLSYREAGRLRAEFGQIVRLEARYRHNGLNRWERTDLSRRLDRLDTLLTAELRDRNDYRGEPSPRSRVPSSRRRPERRRLRLIRAAVRT